MSTASLGVDFGVLHAINLWAAFAAPAPGGRMQLRDLVFHEERPDLGEIELVSDEASVSLPAAVIDVFMPQTNYDRMDSLYLWRGWFEGPTVCALADPKAPPVRVTLEGPGMRLVRPALSVESGEMQVPVLGAGGRQLVLVRFQMPAGGSPAGGEVVWTLPLDRPAAGACASLGPATTGSLKKVAILSKEEGGVSLQVIDLPERGKPGKPARLELKGFEPVPGGHPGMFIDVKGSAHVSAIIAKEGSPKELSVIDVRFPATPEGGIEQSVKSIREIASLPVAAGVSWQSHADRPLRRDWAVLLKNGKVLSSQTENPPMALEGVPVVPLELVSRSQCTYLLTTGPAGPLLESLH